MLAKNSEWMTETKSCCFSSQTQRTTEKRLKTLTASVISPTGVSVSFHTTAMKNVRPIIRQVSTSIFKLDTFNRCCCLWKLLFQYRMMCAPHGFCYYSCQENDNNGNMPLSERETIKCQWHVWPTHSICYFKLKMLACQDVWLFLNVWHTCATGIKWWPTCVVLEHIQSC